MKLEIDTLYQDLELDTSYQDDVICPHCGHKFADSWEFDDGKLDCYECEKEFEIVRNVKITYSTYKIKEGEAAK